MTAGTFGGWLALTVGLTLLPGADTFVVLRTALRAGTRPALLTGLGVSAGVLVWGVAAAVGLAALVSRWPWVDQGIRLLGAAYLIWLGLRTLLGRRSLTSSDTAADGTADGTSSAADGPEPVARQPFTTGLLTNVLNPKVGVFYVSVLPQFIPAGSGFAASLLWGAALALVHNAEGMAWFAVLAVGVDRARRVLARRRAVRVVESVVGIALVGFGIRVAADAR